MGLINTFNFVIKHPLAKSKPTQALWRYIQWQIKSRLVSGDIIHEWINGVKFFAHQGETGLTGNIYVGLHEFNDMAFLLHYASADDLFIDIGANVGSYSLLACGVKGAKGFAFEPVKKTYTRLVKNIALNSLEKKVKTRNLGLGSKPGFAFFTIDENCTNHVSDNKFYGPNDEKLKVETLDNLLRHKKPSILKIDVEGYELPVLNGGKETLKKSSLTVAIIEINGSGSRYGFKDRQIFEIMEKHNFRPFSYNPFKRKLLKLENRNKNSSNVLFIRNIEKVMKKIEFSKSLKLSGINF